MSDPQEEMIAALAEADEKIERLTAANVVLAQQLVATADALEKALGAGGDEEGNAGGVDTHVAPQELPSASDLAIGPQTTAAVERLSCWLARESTRNNLSPAEIASLASAAVDIRTVELSLVRRIVVDDEDEEGAEEDDGALSAEDVEREAAAEHAAAQVATEGARPRSSHLKEVALTALAFLVMTVPLLAHLKRHAIEIGAGQRGHGWTELLAGGACGLMIGFLADARVPGGLPLFRERASIAFVAVTIAGTYLLRPDAADATAVLGLGLIAYMLWEHTRNALDPRRQPPKA